MKAEYIQHMGTDLTVVNSARVSFNKESDWEYGGNIANDPNNKSLSEKDIKLINYLAKHNHWTPFSHVQITLRETVPIFVARQRFKHMVGFTYNEVSRRYVDDPPEFFMPDKWRKRAENAKQGSSDEEILTLNWYNSDGSLVEQEIKQAYIDFIDYAARFYDALLTAGVAPEQARMVLPQSMYTSYYVTGSLAAWARAFKLRIDGHAQLEIQELAKQWDTIVKNIPELKYSWLALTN